MTRIAPKIYPTGFSLRPRTPYQPGSALKYAPRATGSQTVCAPKKNFFRRIFDKFFTKAPEEICTDNFVTLRHSKFLGFEESGYNIFHGSKKVGYVHYDIHRNSMGWTSNYPSSWFDDYAIEDMSGKCSMKPFMRINEFSMNDRLGKSKLIPRDKKYGAMAMKEILRAANEEGCGDRISLLAGNLGGTKFGPGRFYNKMGFSPAPTRARQLEVMERRYYLKLEKLVRGGLSEDEAKAVLKRQKIKCPEKINGRYVEDEGLVNLTNPECIREYPV